MTIVLYLLLLATLIALLLVNAVTIRRTSVSRFELNTRIARGNAAAKQIVHREQLVHDIQSLQKILIALLVVMIVLLAIAASGWFAGTIVAVVIALEFGFISHRSPIQSFAQARYNRFEPRIISFLDRHHWILAPLRHGSDTDSEHVTIHSKEEFLHMAQNTSVLSDDEKQAIRATLALDATIIRDVMVPFDNVVTVPERELLGPLVLNDLHTSGQSRFPVVNKAGIVTGVLDIRQMLTINAGKHSTTAQKAMTPGIQTIQQDATLLAALQLFAREQSGLLMIVEGDTQLGFVDPVTVTEAATGRQL